MSFDTARINWDAAKRVGEGAFGIVLPYTDPANDPQGDKWVVKYAESFDPKKTMIMLQEIVVGSKCNHPNILRLKSCFIDVDERGKWHVYLKLPRMKTNLDDYQKEREKSNKPLKQEEVIKFFFGIVSGLEQLHLNKIAHRDIKPANVLLDNKGEVKLADFGVVVDIDGKTSVLVDNTAGSKSFMAPEVEAQNQLKHKELLKADMWSVGITIAKLCLGAKFKPVEKGEYPLERKEEFLRKTLSELEGVYDRELLNLIISMIRQDPNDRPTVKEVREILQCEYSDLLGVEKIEPSLIKHKEEERKSEEIKKPQSIEEKKPEEVHPSNHIKSTPGKQEEKVELSKIEERPGEETGSIKKPIRPKSEKKEEKVEAQPSSVVEDKRDIEPAPVGQPVRVSSEKKDSQPSEEIKADESNLTMNRSKSDNKNEKAELDELKELKKHMESSLKEKFNFKIAKNPARIIIAPENQDLIDVPTLKNLTDLLHQFKGGETGKNLKGLSISLTYLKENLNRGFRQLVSDICAHCPNLIYLELSFWGSSKNVDNAFIKHISQQLSTRLNRLEYLGLFFDECENITGTGVEHLSIELIPKLSGLKTLKLNFNACNQVSNESINQLCSAIGQNLSHLEMLNLYFQECIEIKDDTVSALGAHLAPLKGLNKLVLSLTNCTEISKKALEDLAKNIGQNLKSLKSLELAFFGLKATKDTENSMRAALEGIGLKLEY